MFIDAFVVVGLDNSSLGTATTRGACQVFQPVLLERLPVRDIPGCTLPPQVAVVSPDLDDDALCLRASDPQCSCGSRNALRLEDQLKGY